MLAQVNLIPSQGALLVLFLVVAAAFVVRQVVHVIKYKFDPFYRLQIQRDSRSVVNRY